MFSLLLATFFYWPGGNNGFKPLELTGEDMRADWTNHAMEATVCVTPRLPGYHILQSWHKLGAKFLKKIEYDPEESAEYFRRRIGPLAIHEGADGVWLVGREKYPPAWKEAFAEAEKDVAAILYATELAEKAMKMRFTAPNTWMAGRHVLWQLEFMDFEMENLDTIRLEFTCYARYLEQLMNLPKKDLPFEASKPSKHPDRKPIVPFEGKSVEAKSVSLVPKEAEPLAPGLSFWRHGGNVGFVVESKKKLAKGKWPGGSFTLKFYLPGKEGTYLPYEWTYDLSPIEEAGRAPSDAYGLWFGDERWGKGKIFPYQDPKPWRIRTRYRGSRSPDYPHIRPSIRLDWVEGGGWRATFEFQWHQIYHQWPSIKNGQHDRWYVGVTGTDIPEAYARIDWPAGRDANFKKMAGLLDYEGLSRFYESELGKSKDIYYLWYLERLYDWQKVPEQTWHRGDTQSDKIFYESVVEPLVASNEHIWDIVYSCIHGLFGVPNSARGPKIGKLPEADKLKVWKGLGKLFDLSYKVSVLRRDYLLGRKAGKLPPPPPKKKPKEGAAAITAPDVDNDDNGLKLDEEAF